MAHSAGGWIARLLLGSSAPYDGRTFAAAPRVSALVTLGTPHVSADRITRRNLKFVNNHCSIPAGVAFTLVAGRGVAGKDSLFGGDLTWQSYKLCCGDGGARGDAIVPTSCALGIPLGEFVAHVEVDAVHDPREARWYGTGAALEQWMAALPPLPPRAT